MGEVDPVLVIFEHWKQATARPDEHLLKARRSVIQARLDEGVSAALICRAISHAAQDPFYQGRTAKCARRLDTLEVICKTTDRILGLASEARSDNGLRISMLKPAAQRTAENAAAVAARYEADVIDAEAPSVQTIEGSAA